MSQSAEDEEETGLPLTYFMIKPSLLMRSPDQETVIQTFSTSWQQAMIAP